MATEQECLAAITMMTDRFNTHDAGNKRERVPRRSIGVTVLDLDITVRGDLVDGYLVNVVTDRNHKADMRLICQSDDLIAMVDGELPIAQAWSSGRVRIDASLRDMMRMRALL